MIKYIVLPALTDSTASAELRTARSPRLMWLMLMTAGLLTFSLMLASCSSGSSSPEGPPPPPSATSEIVTVGPISGFGSVFSNGVEFETGSVTVTMDGEPAALSDLGVGMVVSIIGTFNAATETATASEIRFADDVEGLITSIDTVNNKIVVLGQTVLIDELSVFENATFEALAAGNVVQVSGQWRSQNRIQAMHIMRKSNAYMSGMGMVVKGEISALNTVTQRFNIGAQSCVYSAAMLELGDAELADGLYVEVSSQLPLSNGELVLDRLWARDRDRDRDQLCGSGCEFELEGYVTLFVSTTNFEVDGMQVSTTDSTIYVNGTADTLAPDIKLAVDGTVDASGILVADRIVFRLPSLIEIQADLEAIDASNAAITVLGIAVTTNDSTMFRDDSDFALREFGLDDLATGDRIKVRGYLDGDTVVATRLERDDANDSVTLKAPVESVSRPSLTLLAVTATSDQDTVYQNTEREVIDADEFYSLVTIGSLVKVEGTYDGASILADKMFLRDCEGTCP